MRIYFDTDDKCSTCCGRGVLRVELAPEDDSGNVVLKALCKCVTERPAARFQKEKTQ